MMNHDHFPIIAQIFQAKCPLLGEQIVPLNYLLTVDETHKFPYSAWSSQYALTSLVERSD